MKKALTPFLILLIAILFMGCNSNSKKISLSEGQQKAVDNSIEFIRKSAFTSKDRMDTSIIKIEKATANTWKAVHSATSKIDENAVDSTDWLITIGDTFAHNFAIIVCDSITYKVIGYLPIA